MIIFVEWESFINENKPFIKSLVLSVRIIYDNEYFSYIWALFLKISRRILKVNQLKITTLLINLNGYKTTVLLRTVQVEFITNMWHNLFCMLIASWISPQLFYRVSEIISRMNNGRPGSALWMEVDASNSAMHEAAESLDMTFGLSHIINSKEIDDENDINTTVQSRYKLKFISLQRI